MILDYGKFRIIIPCNKANRLYFFCHLQLINTYDIIIVHRTSEKKT